MFGATRDNQSGQEAATPGRSLISSDLQVEGEIESRGAVEVLGEVRGNIRASDVSVAENGRVTGSISAASAVLRGEVNGEISAESVNIHASARIEADITYAAIGIEYGAKVKGGLRQREAARPAAPATPAPARTGTE
jgi:cytoskeletal protein CcmA (bactofilin family)